MLSTPSPRYGDGHLGLASPNARVIARAQDGFVGCDVCAMAQVLGLVVVAPSFTPDTPYELAQWYAFYTFPSLWRRPLGLASPNARARAGRFRLVRRERNGPSAWTGGCCTTFHPTNII